MKRICERRASEVDGTYNDGAPRPTAYALGVEVARRDALVYGVFTLNTFDPPANDYQSAYNDAVADIKDQLADDAQNRIRRRAWNNAPLA